MHLVVYSLDTPEEGNMEGSMMMGCIGFGCEILLPERGKPGNEPCLRLADFEVL